MHDMALSVIEKRFAASMVSGLSTGAVVTGLLYLLWPRSVGELPPVLLALTLVLSLAAGSFVALYWLTHTQHDDADRPS